MSASQPKPAKGGAESHRKKDDEEEASAPPAAPSIEPDDRDGGGGGGGGAPPDSPGSGSSTEVMGVSAKRIALVAAAVVAAYLLWRLWQNRDQLNQTRREASEDEGGVPADGERPLDDDGPQIQRDPDDPLRADHEAGQWVFGWGGED